MLTNQSNRKSNPMKKSLTIAAIAALAFTAIGGTAHATEGDKVTICHAAGQDDTDKYVELTISKNAVYGEAGHFNENGTTQAGHEQDYFGPCESDETTTTLETTTSSSTTIPPSTSSPTTSSVPETSTSSVPPDSTSSSTTAPTTAPTTSDAPSTTTASTPSSLPPILVSEIPEECLQTNGVVLAEGDFVRLSNGDYLISTGTARKIVTFCGPIVAVAQPPVPTTTTPAPATGHTHPTTTVALEMPVTGLNANITWAALATLLSGIFLTLATRRRAL